MEGNRRVNLGRNMERVFTPSCAHGRTMADHATQSANSNHGRERRYTQYSKTTRRDVAVTGRGYEREGVLWLQPGRQRACGTSPPDLEKCIQAKIHEISLQVDEF